MAYTVTEILAGVRRRYFSTDTTAWPDADILALVNEVLIGQVVPWIEKVREDHFIKLEDVALVGGQVNYTLPTDVSGIQLMSVHLLDANGNVLNPPLVETELETFVQLYAGNGQAARYAVRGNDVLLWPVPSSGAGSAGFLRLQYARRPSEIVPLGQATKITALAQGADTFTVSFAALTPAMVTAVQSVGLDIVRAVPGFEVYPQGVGSYNEEDNNIVFPGTAPAAVQVGDWLNVPGQAVVCTYLPAELWPVVYQAVVVEMSGSKGDDDQLGRAEKSLKRLTDAGAAFLDKRVTAGHRKIPGGGWRGGFRFGRLMRPGPQ